jgi:hypothetical protein
MAIKPRLLNAARGATAGSALGYGASYLGGEADAKVPILSGGKLKKNKKKGAMTIQRASIIGGLGAGAAYGLLKKVK